MDSNSNSTVAFLLTRETENLGGSPIDMENHGKRKSAGNSPINNAATHDKGSSSLVEIAGGASPAHQPISASSPVAGDAKSELRFKDKDEYLNSFPPGYRFNPSDSELISSYLANKISGKELPPNKIQEVKLYTYSPDVLTAKYQPAGDDEWYFFTPRDRKYRNGQRPNRAAGDGYWKATGADRPVNDANGNKIGSKKSLVFYRGKPLKGNKTDWIMHEFGVLNAPKRRRTSGDDMVLDDCVLCRIHKKQADSSKSQVKEKGNTSQVQEQKQERNASTNQQILTKYPTLLPKEPQQESAYHHNHQQAGDGDGMWLASHQQPYFQYDSYNGLPPFPESLFFDPSISRANALISDIQSHMLSHVWQLDAPVREGTRQEDQDNELWFKIYNRDQLPDGSGAQHPDADEKPQIE